MVASVYAGEKTIFLMTESYHTPQTESDINISNNHNYGLGYEYTGEVGLGPHIGIYYNSYGKASVFVGAHLEKPITTNLKYSLSLSAVTGYKDLTGNAVSPSFVYGIQYHFIRIVTTYPFAELTGGGSVMNLQLAYDF